MTKTFIYNIGFRYCRGGAEEPAQDEAQFEINDVEVDDDGLISIGEADIIYNELIGLFNKFCDENDFGSIQVNYIDYIGEK